MEYICLLATSALRPIRRFIWVSNKTSFGVFEMIFPMQD